MNLARALVGMGVALAITGCISDQQWEGPVTRCSGNTPDFHAIMLLDGPVGPRVNGLFGQSVNDRNDTFVMGKFKDGTRSEERRVGKECA